MRTNALNLDELQSEVEKLLVLLTDRQPGLITWNMGLNERLEFIQKMLESGCSLEANNNYAPLTCGGN